jgi:undecaprenyl-diphosphatase
VVEALGRFLRQRARQLLLAFAGVALPLLLFAELADEVREAEAFGFDEPLLRLAHGAGSPAMDATMRLASDLGFAWGVIPADVAIFAALVLLGHVRRGLYFGLAVGGSALLNVAAKAVFARERPDLWLSIAPEHTFSFPSGHAMGSATLAAALVLLVSRTRWRWPAALLGAAFVAWVGASRVYLGVHFPSDILAGWAAAVAWACLAYLIVRPNHGGAPSEPENPPG